MMVLILKNTKKTWGIKGTQCISDPSSWFISIKGVLEVPFPRWLLLCSLEALQRPRARSRRSPRLQAVLVDLKIDFPKSLTVRACSAEGTQPGLPDRPEPATGDPRPRGARSGAQGGGPCPGSEPRGSNPRDPDAALQGLFPHSRSRGTTSAWNFPGGKPAFPGARPQRPPCAVPFPASSPTWRTGGT